MNDVAGVRYITYVKIVLRAELLSSLCYWIMILQYRRHKNMMNGLDAAIFKMQRSGEELRNAASENYPGGSPNHVQLLWFACFRMLEIAADLNNNSVNLRVVLCGTPSPSEVLDDLDMDIELNPDDLEDGDWLEENSIDSEEILDHRVK
jgi:hypothetical protein